MGNNSSITGALSENLGKFKEKIENQDTKVFIKCGVSGSGLARPFPFSRTNGRMCFIGAWGNTTSRSGDLTRSTYASGTVLTRTAGAREIEQVHTPNKSPNAATK